MMYVFAAGRRLMLLSLALLLTTGLSARTPDDSTRPAESDERPFYETATDTILIDGKTHTAAEIFIIAERSELAYRIEELDTNLHRVPYPERPLVKPEWYFEQTDSGVTLLSFETSDTAAAVSYQGDLLFEAKLYDSARVLYRQAIALDSTYPLFYNWLGDTYLFRDLYDSAIASYETALALNPNCYQSYWFLANALWKKNDTTESLRYLLRAHVLNINHEDIRMRLTGRLGEMGQEWIERGWEPQCVIGQVDDHTISVIASVSDIADCLCKAIWEYEPGYADSMIAGHADPLFGPYLARANEAAMVMATSNDSVMAVFEAALGEDLLTELIIYEFMLPEHPMLALLFDQEQLARLSLYVMNFRFQRRS